MRRSSSAPERCPRLSSACRRRGGNSGSTPRSFRAAIMMTRSRVCGTPYQAALSKVKVADADEQVGVDIIRRAIEEPIRIIAANAGAEGSIVVERVRSSKEKAFGYNAQTGVFEDLVAAGVIDPTKVVRTALQNAASVASLLLTTECVVVEQESEAATPAMPGGGGMGGMY